MHKLVTCLMVPGIFSIAQSVLAENIPTHCVNDEVTLFACPIKKKVVSYCAAPKAPPYYNIEYRYGILGKVENKFNVDPNGKFADADNMFVSSILIGPNEVINSIWFKAPTSDVITSLLQCSGGNCNSKTPGIVVMKGKKLLAKLMCSNYDVPGDAFSKFPIKYDDSGTPLPNNTELLVEKDNPSEPEELFVNPKIK